MYTVSFPRLRCTLFIPVPPHCPWYQTKLNPDTPKVKCEGKNGVHPDLIFGLDTKLFQLQHRQGYDDHVLRDQEHMRKEVDVVPLHVRSTPRQQERSFTRSQLDLWMASPELQDKEHYYRIKGVVWLHHDHDRDEDATASSLPSSTKDADAVATPPQLYILNFAFGRNEWTGPVLDKKVCEKYAQNALHLTLMGADLLRPGAHNTKEQLHHHHHRDPASCLGCHAETLERVRPHVKETLRKYLGIIE